MCRYSKQVDVDDEGRVEWKEFAKAAKSLSKHLGNKKGWKRQKMLTLTPVNRSGGTNPGGKGTDTENDAPIDATRDSNANVQPGDSVWVELPSPVGPGTFWFD